MQREGVAALFSDAQHRFELFLPRMHALFLRSSIRKNLSLVERLAKFVLQSSLYALGCEAQLKFDDDVFMRSLVQMCCMCAGWFSQTACTTQHRH
jgi:hypothetical protein